MNFTFKSLKLVDALHARAQELQKQQRIAARLRVPPDLHWWFYQEFGTASRGESPPASGKSYIGRLGAITYVHPGIPPRSMVRRVLADIRKAFAMEVAPLVSDLKTPLTADALKLALMSRVMPAAVELIAESFADQLPGTGHELGGKTAADVYRESVTIVETTE